MNFLLLMINSKVFNSIPNARAVNAIPQAAVSSFQTTKAGDFITPGMPIGLLLVLTYAEQSQAGGSYSDFRPNASIKSM